MKSKWTDGPLWHPDRLSGAVLVAIGAFLLYSAAALPFGHLKAPDAGFFPTILATLLLLLGVVLVVRSFRAPAFSLEMSRRSWAVLAGAVGFLLYALLLERIGFLICTLAAMLVLMRAYGGMSWRLCLLVGAPLVLAVYLGFDALGVQLPRGILGF